VSSGQHQTRTEGAAPAGAAWIGYFVGAGSGAWLAGALALLTALDVQTGKVFASCPPATGIAPFTTLMGQVMNQQPYASAPRVFVIVDNGSDHRGQAAITRLATAYPNAIMIHTPVHASWLNQVEIVFSIIQKKVLTPSDFRGTSALSHALLAFVHRYNLTARPFSWKFTASDLTRLLHRISDRKPSGPQHTDLTTAA